MTASDIKHTLRKLEFPFCAREALGRIEQLCSVQTGSHAHISRQAELASDLIIEFVFCELDRRGSKRRRLMYNLIRFPDGSEDPPMCCKCDFWVTVYHILVGACYVALRWKFRFCNINGILADNEAIQLCKKLSCIQELQLLEVLCDYLSYPGGNDAARNAVFMSLFPGSHPERSRLLVKLVSMAISTSNSPVLMATAILMQQLSCTSKFSIQLANGLVNDYFVLVPKSVDRLKELPKIAPLFTANFLAAVTEMFGCTLLDIHEGTEWRAPPVSLLEVITEWVSEQPALCVTALIVDLQPALPSGGIPMPAITPYSGLFKWTVLSTLYETDENVMLLYDQLHLALLESLVDCVPPEAKRPDHIISAQHLATIVPFIVDSNFKANHGKLQQAINRLGQAIQLALHTKSVYGNKRDLLKRLESLPKNRLMKMVLNAHREAI